MPQPPLPDVLLALKPYIHGLVVLARLLQWKPYTAADSSVPPMLLAVLLWTAAWFHHKILFGVVVPLVLAYSLATMHDQPQPKPFRPRRRQSNTAAADSKLADEDPNIAEITKELAELSESLSFTSNLNHSFSFDRKTNVVICSLLTFFWQYIIHSAQLSQLAWLTGCVFLTWWSPWVHTVRQLIHQQRERRRQKKLSSISVADTKQELDRMYCFSIYEHQRWWLHCGWTNLMLPHDRPEWSDEYLEPTPSIDAFSLPPPSSSSHWLWSDPSWKPDMSGVKDDDGWEYGNWDWKAWSNKRSGLSILTRRRRWIRCARFECTDDTESVAASSAASSASTCSSPSLLFSPQPRPSSLLTHRTLSSITTISSTSSCEPAKKCETHFWLHR